MNQEHEATIAVLRNLYAKQAHLIDTGQHDDWAHTFTPNGEFNSPSYGQPAVGYDQLAGISKTFSESAAQNGERHRHLIENIWVVKSDASTAHVRAYVLILATRSGQTETRILRVVTNDDQLEKSGDDWVVRARTVTY
ncbi:MAG: nuclear transport factor 2 family protein [Alcaligenaceae bacterium]|nr:nuclear transport factor 2 family protein [Alcaligenaceae bacterium]